MCESPLGPVWGFVSDLCDTAGYIAPTIALDALVPEIRLGTLVYSVARGGDAYKRTRAEGYSDVQALNYGLAIAGLTALIRYATGSSGTIQGDTSSGFSEIVGHIAKNSLKHGGMVYVETQFNYLLRNLCLGEENEITLFDKEAIGNAGKAVISMAVILAMFNGVAVEQYPPELSSTDSPGSATGLVPYNPGTSLTPQSLGGLVPFSPNPFGVFNYSDIPLPPPGLGAGSFGPPALPGHGGGGRSLDGTGSGQLEPVYGPQLPDLEVEQGLTLELSGWYDENGDVLSSQRLGHIAVTEEAIARVPNIRISGLDSSANDRLWEANKDILRAAQEYPLGTEIGMRYSLDMTPLEDNYIVGDENDHIKLRGADIIIHTHPDGASFSHSDILSFRNATGVKIFVAMGHDGDAYILIRTAAYDNAGFRKACDKLLEKAQPLWDDGNIIEYVETINEFLEEVEQYGVRFIEGRT